MTRALVGPHNAPVSNSLATRRPLRLALVAALLVALAAATSACTTPCKELSKRLCAMQPDDDEQCEKWKARVGRVTTETCEAGLRKLDRDRVR